ncbi:MAG: alpha/beta hydrolase [Cognatishimia sp.]|nr:alpha/beta hydrolase [Cognatishimia sp.]
MKKLVIWIASALAVIAGALAFVWFVNPFGVRDQLIVAQIVKMRVAPARLENIKDPGDYGMAFTDVDIVTADNIRLSAWEIPAASPSDKTVIVNHPLTTTRYGSDTGLDGVSAEFLPMVKHLHDAGYNIVMYDHRGQGDSDGGTGSTAIGTEALVGAGVTEWQDVAASLRYVLSHTEFADDEIVFLSQCMGANATFLAWKNEPELFANTQIKGLIANQPTLSYNMTDRFIRAKTGFDLVDRVLEAQRERYGFGFAEALDYVPSLTVPVLFAQVEKDVYTFNTETGQNDIQEIMDATPTEHSIVWIGPDQEIPFGTGSRFDGYQYFNHHPEALLEFLSKHTS